MEGARTEAEALAIAASLRLPPHTHILTPPFYD
jgi:hypothetical protein